ncbi:MAG: hormogonium polysaccharide secretion pseudopilin HpsC [Symplocastrum torsivum CPER-KK1]|jgi:type II secretory pathway pseudopilin PulG|uniref:Hormogonium polysaccharide secretion pseudopilin HpsC n=1 Tax=Symplocastrum torsivum CPER-KK1 TaxID=450513 RepID=A0A951PGF4_9CYAN|nr:hormogonium polysaccharide secretion pseudopilin HpsC [Symplocastrum torsivum CPER-KK1]
MMRLLKSFRTHKLKNSPPHHKTGGFTLIELLVGIIMTSLIITPLLGLVINMMDTDRKEQAKATSEQEIQAALDYIARDLDQAFFIYDGAGLSAIEARLPSVAVANPGAQGEPVLVFWKREFLPNSVPLSGSNIAQCANNDPGNNCDDGFVYSLVGYYLIKDANCINSSWSCTTRISRIELKDALYNVNNPNPSTNRTPLIAGYEASDGLVPIEQLLEQAGSLEEQLTIWPTNINWTRAQRSASYNYGDTQFVTLIDYIDQTPGSSIATQPACSPNPRPNETTPYLNRQVPDPATVGAGFPIDSFYACVSTDQTVAQVFIRGNALARIRPKNPPPVYAANQSSYFPRASIQAQGSGLLNVNSSP